jgi:hypothetical protein
MATAKLLDLARPGWAGSLRPAMPVVRCPQDNISSIHLAADSLSGRHPIRSTLPPITPP